MGIFTKTKRIIEVVFFLALGLGILGYALKDTFNLALLAYAGKATVATVESAWVHKCGKRSICASTTLVSDEGTFHLRMHADTQVGQQVPIVFLERNHSLVMEGTLESPFIFMANTTYGDKIGAFLLALVLLVAAYISYKEKPKVEP